MDLRGNLILGMPCAALLPTSKPDRPRYSFGIASDMDRTQKFKSYRSRILADSQGVLAIDIPAIHGGDQSNAERPSFREARCFLDIHSEQR